MSKNGETLRQLIASVNLGPDEALVIWNKGQAVPLTVGADARLTHVPIFYCSTPGAF